MPREIKNRLVPNVLMVGTGEYTTGFVHDKESKSDKGKGVVALVLFDQKRQGLVGNLSMAGTNGSKFPQLRFHLQKEIGDCYRDMDMSFQSFPSNSVRNDSYAYLKAMSALEPGDCVTIFTPDNTHYDIARAALDRGLHVLIAKPAVKTLEQHVELIRLAQEKGLLAEVEVHKRYDPIYSDARARVRALGDFSYLRSYMGQPKIQLDTFRKWAGSSSDISYYLNSHHVDWHVWAMEGIARPTRVEAISSRGIAKASGIDTEDVITLIVEWTSLSNPNNTGIAIYTAGWIEPKSDAHSQQRFECMMHRGKVEIDQTRRGYIVTGDESGYMSVNPLFMRYNPDGDGFFNGQTSYGYVSIAEFIKAVSMIINGEKKSMDFSRTLPILAGTAQVTAILEAGRISLDHGGMVPISISYDAQNKAMPILLK